MSIVASGARCGVYVLDERRHEAAACRGNFHLADLEADALTLSWSDGGFTWRASATMASCRSCSTSRRRPSDSPNWSAPWGGRQGRQPRRSTLRVHRAAEPADWWTGDSRAGLDVPLGRAGAMKLQQLALGKGTSQHVLISGKTGSGKSTLLHVLITNLALHYSPDEIELYLVDFKKGVEFKAYARFALPHARVVAVESEREFGLSVLQHLDAELRRRGDLFRNLGVQDLKGYRTAQPDGRCRA